MIESPLVQQWKAEAVHEVILDILKDRFSTVPRDVSKLLAQSSRKKNFASSAASPPSAVTSIRSATQC